MRLIESRTRQRGISLIEALVALAVMAFGMLGVVGMQSTLRSNGDLSRQRAEAMRLAQEEVERLRQYTVLLPAEATASMPAFGNIASQAASEVAADNANTVFTRETVVATPDPDDPLVRHLSVVVRWTDRQGLPQNVRLNTLIAGVIPELGALPSMRTDRGALQQPLGRHSAIPRGATTNEGGLTSSFTPPGAAPGYRWVFNNATGFITSICTGASDASCTSARRQLLSGIVAFATGAAPTSAEAENPIDAAVPLSMEVVVTLPTATPNGVCFIDSTVTNRRSYFCAVPMTIASRWSGRVVFGTLPLATNLATSSATTYKVCRYTPDLVNNTTNAVPSGQSELDYNARHPYQYIRSTQPQTNKNFLVISSGNGSGTAYTCPADDTGTAVRSDTFPHQPIS